MRWGSPQADIWYDHEIRALVRKAVLAERERVLKMIEQTPADEFKREWTGMGSETVRYRVTPWAAAQYARKRYGQ